MSLTLKSKLALKVGIKTKEYKTLKAHEAHLAHVDHRKAVFLNKSKDDALKVYPELADVYKVKDEILSFYQEVVGDAKTNIQTYGRNEQRARVSSLDALNALDNNKPIPLFTRKGREKDAKRIKLDELKQLRAELSLTYDEATRVSPEVLNAAQTNYITWSDAYFKDKNQALKKHPELHQIEALEKRAKRYYKEWVEPNHLDKAIKHVVNDGIIDLSRGFILKSAEELKEDALQIRQTDIGIKSNVANSKKREDYEYAHFDWFKNLIGRNGLNSGLWPYQRNAQIEADIIKGIDDAVKLNQMITAFNQLPKEQALKKHPELALIYKKFNAALGFYEQKIDEDKALKSAQMLVEEDFERALKGQVLKAITEYSSQDHETIIHLASERVSAMSKGGAVDKDKTSQTLKDITSIISTEFQGERVASNEDIEMDHSPSKDEVVIDGTLVTLDLLKRHIKEQAIIKSKEGVVIEFDSMGYNNTIYQIINECELTQADKKKLIEALQYDESEVAKGLLTQTNDDIADIIANSAHTIEKKDELVVINARETKLEEIEQAFLARIDKEGLDLSHLESIMDEYFSVNFISDSHQLKICNYLKEKGHLKEQYIDEPQISPAPEYKNGHVVDLAKITSTAPMHELTQAFDTSHTSSFTLKQTNYKRWDVQAIEHGLKERAEEFAIELLGEPRNRLGNEISFGSNKGSLKVAINGEKAGVWNDFQTGEKGRMIKLAMVAKELDFKHALDYCGTFLGMEPEKRGEKKQFDISNYTSLNLTERQLKKIHYAKELADSSVPIDGTLAETYLKNTRGIDTSRVSGDVRFIKSVEDPITKKHFPALLVVGKNLSGEVQGVQVTYLDKDGQKAPGLPENKISHGLIKGSAIPVHKGGNMIAVAEGVETALSIANARSDLTVFAALGSITNFSAIDMKANGQTIIVCADNDPGNIQANQKVQRAEQELKAKGFNVFTARPSEQGKDFNDVLQEQGIDKVKELINHPSPYTPNKEPNLQAMPRSVNKQRVKKLEAEMEL